MDQNVKNSFKTLGELTNLLSEKRANWSQQLLVASSTLFGVLIALQRENSVILTTRLFFALALVSLALGILLSAIVLYSHVGAISRARKIATKEAVDALREDRAMKPVAAPERRIFLACEKLSYICFVLSIVLLSAYAVLFALNG